MCGYSPHAAPHHVPRPWPFSLSVVCRCPLGVQVMGNAVGLTSSASFLWAEDTAMITLASPTSTVPVRCPIAIFAMSQVVCALAQSSCSFHGFHAAVRPVYLPTLQHVGTY
jgi:hypothetical protein